MIDLISELDGIGTPLNHSCRSRVFSSFSD